MVQRSTGDALLAALALAPPHGSPIQPSGRRPMDVTDNQAAAIPQEKKGETK